MMNVRRKRFEIYLLESASRLQQAVENMGDDLPQDVRACVERASAALNQAVDALGPFWADEPGTAAKDPSGGVQ